MNVKNAERPVLVVGGRTTGLMMASELARHGVSVRIVDKSPGIDPHSRATVLHSRTQEILHGLGIASQVIQSAQPMRGICLYANGRRIVRSQEDAVDSPFPVGVSLSQAKTENVLERHLNSFGVTVERSTELTAMEQNASGIRVTLKHADGREEDVDTPWLIGCDGAHSTVRHFTELVFPGEADPHPYMLADVVVSGPLKPEDAYIFLNDHGDLFFFLLDEGRRLVVANSPKGSDLSKAPTLEQMQEVVTRRSLPDFRLSDPRWLTHFHIHYRLAPHYRHGRAFLAGDAAHVHSLIGGQGMNTGIQDAHNLAWKLALVMRGVVPGTWLDTYEAERRQIAEDVIKTTKASTERTEAFAGLSPREREKLVEHMFVPEAEKMQVRRHAEEIDLDYRSSSICIEPDEGFEGGPHAGARALDTTQIRVNGKTCTLFDLFRSPHHHLLLFPPTTCGDLSTDLVSAAESAVKAHHHWIDVFVVESQNSQLSLPPDVTIIKDPKRSLRQRYGADTASLYLIRPDGYAAYRSRRLDSLGEYLHHVL